MVYLTAIGLTSGGSSTIHIYTQTIHRTTQSTQYIEQHNSLIRKSEDLAPSLPSLVASSLVLIYIFFVVEVGGRGGGD
jgi:hypothetical protein